MANETMRDDDRLDNFEEKLDMVMRRLEEFVDASIELATRDGEAFRQYLVNDLARARTNLTEALKEWKNV